MMVGDRGIWVGLINDLGERCTRKAHSLRRDGESDEGFTLIELLIVVVILPLVVGSIALGLVSVLSLQTSVSARLTDSGYAQTVSSTFLRDVQSASILTQQSSTQCGAGLGLTQLLGLAWNGDSSGSGPSGYTTWVSYAVKANASGASYSLFREFCGGGSTAPTSATIVSSDISPSIATTPPSVCVTTPSVSCSTSAFSSGWTTTSVVSSVTWPLLETLSTVPGTAGKFGFTLGATPRLLGNTKDSTPSTLPHSPLTLLGFANSCTNPVLQVGGSNTTSKGVSIYVNDSSSGAYGGVTIGSSCTNSVQIANTGILNASAVYTPNPTVNLFATSGNNPGTPPPPVYSTNSPVFDPFAAQSSSALVAPNVMSLPPVSCSQASSNVYNCPPGKYNTDPGSALGTGDTINFTGGTYDFTKGFTLTNGISANFGQGVYVFDQNAGGYAFDTGNNDTITATSLGALLYIESGQFFLGNGSMTTIPSLPTSFNGGDYHGVAIWDAAANGQSLPLTLGSNANNSSFTGGGLYVPNGGVVDSNNGTLTTTFIVAQWANFNNGLTVNILGPGP